MPGWGLVGPCGQNWEEAPGREQEQITLKGRSMKPGMHPGQEGGGSGLSGQPGLPGGGCLRVSLECRSFVNRVQVRWCLQDP